MRCEKGLGEYTPWYKYKKRHYPVKNLTFEYSYIWRKNKETGKWEWRSNPCEDFRVEIPIQKSVTGKVIENYNSWSKLQKKIEGKILTCESEYYDDVNKQGKKDTTIFDFEKLKKIERTFRSGYGFYGRNSFENKFSCETLAQKKAREIEEEERRDKLDKDRTYAGVIMGSKFMDNPLTQNLRFSQDFGYATSSSNFKKYRYADFFTRAFFYNENFEQANLRYDANIATIQKILVEESRINKEKLAIILKNMDSKYQLLWSTSRSKKYSNKSDEIYVEWSDKYNYPDEYSSFKIQYKSKELVKAEELASKAEELARFEKDKREKAARNAKWKKETSGF